MTIQINKPEVEALINQRLWSGAFKDAEDVILQALQASPPTPPHSDEPTTNRYRGTLCAVAGPQFGF
jgi:hypothetical protein